MAEDQEHSSEDSEALRPTGGPSGLSTPLQPGGLAPGGGPAASNGGLGTGGAQTGDADSGSLQRGGR